MSTSKKHKNMKCFFLFSIVLTCISIHHLSSQPSTIIHTISKDANMHFYIEDIAMSYQRNGEVVVNYTTVLVFDNTTDPYQDIEISLVNIYPRGHSISIYPKGQWSILRGEPFDKTNPKHRRLSSLPLENFDGRESPLTFDLSVKYRIGQNLKEVFSITESFNSKERNTTTKSKTENDNSSDSDAEEKSTSEDDFWNGIDQQNNIETDEINFWNGQGAQDEEALLEQLSAVENDDFYIGAERSRTNQVRIFCRDTGNEDGDRVRIINNGNSVNSNVYLTNAGKSYWVDLSFGQNRIEFEALNQGSVGPNTAEFSIYDDKDRQLATRGWNLLTGNKGVLLITKI